MKVVTDMLADENENLNLGPLLRALENGQQTLEDAGFYDPSFLSYVGSKETSAQRNVRELLVKNGVDHQDADDFIRDANLHVDWRVLRPSDLLNLPDPEWLIPGVLEEGTANLLYGPSGAGKSFVAFDAALSIATGTNWLGEYSVQQGPAVYVAAEGAHGYTKRYRAWLTAHDVSPALADLLFIPHAINLYNQEQAFAFAEQFAPVAPKLIVFDTLARCSVGAEENSNADTNKITSALQHIINETGATVLVPHHVGKDPSKGARGASALSGNFDGAIELRPLNNSAQISDIDLLCEKLKNAAPFEPIHVAFDSAEGSLVPRSVNSHRRGSEDKEIRAAIMSALEDAEEPLSQTKLEERVTGFRTKTIRDVARRCAMNDHDVIQREKVGNGYRYSLKPRSVGTGWDIDDEGEAA